MPSLLELGATNTPASSVIVEVKSAMLNATPGNIAFTYVDQDGNAAETIAAESLGASATYGQAGWMPLNTPDWGVRSVSSATQSGGTTPTGLVDIYGMIPLSLMCMSPGGFGMSDNIITHHFNYIRLPAGAEIAGYALQNTGAKSVLGEVFIVGDS